MSFFFLNFIYGLPVGAAFAWFCILSDNRTLTVDFVAAVLAVVAIVAVGLTAVMGQQAGYYAVFALLVFVDRPSPASPQAHSSFTVSRSIASADSLADHAYQPVRAEKCQIVTFRGDAF